MNTPDYWDAGLAEARKLHDQLVTDPVWEAEDRVFNSNIHSVSSMDEGENDAWKLQDIEYGEWWAAPLKCDCDEGHIYGDSQTYLSWQFEGEDHLAWIYRT